MGGLACHIVCTGSRLVAIGFVSAFVLLYLFAPAIASGIRHPLDGPAARAMPRRRCFLVPGNCGGRSRRRVSMGAVRATSRAARVCAWRSVAIEPAVSSTYCIVLAVATEAMWSAQHLTVERLPSTVSLCRVRCDHGRPCRWLRAVAGRPLQPAGGAGLVLLASLGLLLFLSTGPIAPEALWALALLAILNAGIFVESVPAGFRCCLGPEQRTPWVILALWWVGTAGVVGVLPSLRCSPA